ncbi:MAG: hypothetical protein JWM33_2619 [Caulobacteraceae bacterium]|nr:hypothetical protein [Caulobacteraceae bacterium]
MRLRTLLAASLVLAAPLSLAIAQVATPAAPAGPANRVAQVTAITQADLLKRAGAEWLNYHGDFTGDRYSTLGQINRTNVSRLKLAWTSEVTQAAAAGGLGGGRGGGRAAAVPPVPGTPEAGNWGVNTGVPASFDADAVTYAPPNAGTGGIRSTPLMRNGVLFYTNGVNAYAVDGHTGKQIWRYVATSSAGLSNRGLAMAGDTLFMMANGGLTAIDAKTGAELWRKASATNPPATAPTVVRDHVIFGVGNDSGAGARSWLESRNAKTGEIEWRWDATPKEGEAGLETWPSLQASNMGAGTPWAAPVYDPALNLIFIGSGNPTRSKDGRLRTGDNLWTSSIVAINPDTGKMAWFFQMTPHDDHDYDGNQSLMQFEATIDGKPRKLIGMVGRQGYMFVVDRVTGKHVYTRKVLDDANFALPKARANGVLEPDPRKSPSRGGALVNPSSEGATNFPSATYSPQTGLIYTHVVNSWSEFYTGGAETWFGSFTDTFKAYDAKTGQLKWSHAFKEPYAIQARYPGSMSTLGGLIFTGDPSGNAIAFDAATGKILWHDLLPNTVVTNSPITYQLDGKQYVLFGTRDNLMAYTLP